MDRFVGGWNGIMSCSESDLFKVFSMGYSVCMRCRVPSDNRRTKPPELNTHSRSDASEPVYLRNDSHGVDTTTIS